jgi:hypothetical protein
MAAAWFNRLADPAKARAISAGTDPGTHVHPEVVAAMREIGVDLAGATTTRLTTDIAQQGQWLVISDRRTGERGPTLVDELTDDARFGLLGGDRAHGQGDSGHHGQDRQGAQAKNVHETPSDGVPAHA